MACSPAENLAWLQGQPAPMTFWDSADALPLSQFLLRLMIQSIVADSSHACRCSRGKASDPHSSWQHPPGLDQQGSSQSYPRAALPHLLLIQQPAGSKSQTSAPLQLPSAKQLGPMETSRSIYQRPGSVPVGHSQSLRRPRSALLRPLRGQTVSHRLAIAC